MMEATPQGLPPSRAPEQQDLPLGCREWGRRVLASNCCLPAAPCRMLHLSRVCLHPRKDPGPQPAKLPVRLLLITGLLLPAGNLQGAYLMSH